MHSAIVTAASRVRGEQLGMDYVRVLSPINFRSHIDDDAACADYFICAVTGMAPSDGATFWEQARAAGAQLGSARSAGGVLATSAAVADAIGTDAEVGAAAALFTTALPFDLLISNLGAQDLKSVGPLRPSAVWAPVLETQIAGSTVIGVTTYQGVLRMVASGYSPTDEYLEAVAAYLRNIVG